MEYKKVKGNLLDIIVPIAILVAIILILLNNFMLFERRVKFAEAGEILKEQLRPSEINVIKIIQEDCDFCFDIEEAMNELKKQNVNITNEETLSSSSQQAKGFILKYDIKKLPTIIVSGEINKSEQLSTYFEQKGEIREEVSEDSFKNAFIYTSLTPPYFDVSSNQIKGMVEIKHIVDSSCEGCVDLTSISSALEEQGVYIQDEQFIDYNSNEGKSLVNKFGVKQVPAILISEQIDEYNEVKDALLQSGATKKEGFYVVHSALPPYRDISKDRIVGIVDVVYLNKEDCVVCYDVSINRNILLNFGMKLNEENTYDINSQEGKQLVQKYDIKKAPIIILSPDSEYYPSLVQAWKSVGTIEDDGWFVMRNPEIIGTYWDLENGGGVMVGTNG